MIIFHLYGEVNKKIRYRRLWSTSFVKKTMLLNWYTVKAVSDVGWISNYRSTSVRLLVTIYILWVNLKLRYTFTWITQTISYLIELYNYARTIVDPTIEIFRKYSISYWMGKISWILTDSKNYFFLIIVFIRQIYSRMATKLAKMGIDWP